MSNFGQGFDAFFYYRKLVREHGLDELNGEQLLQLEMVYLCSREQPCYVQTLLLSMEKLGSPVTLYDRTRVLVEKGYLLLERDEVDKRRKRVHLTEKAVAHLEALGQAMLSLPNHKKESKLNWLKLDLFG